MKARVRAAVIGALVAVAGVPGSAGADPGCDSKVVVFGYTAGATANPNAVKCVVDRSDDRDGRVLLPGASQISVRYAGDLNPPPAKIDVRLNGFGFTNRWTELTREQLYPGTPVAQWVYNGPRIDLAASTGCVLAEVVFNKGTPDQTVFASNRFRTVDASC